MYNPYDIVTEFEKAIARRVGAQHAVALDSCTNALELALRYVRAGEKGYEVQCPRHTFLAAPMAIRAAGAPVRFVDEEWTGMYRLHPYLIWDSAVQCAPGSYPGGLMCLSFQYRKPIPIGKGGMVCTNNAETAKWLRRARNLGRDIVDGRIYDLNDVTEQGWNRTMMPEQAARGLSLLQFGKGDGTGSWKDYPDVSVAPFFRDAKPAIGWDAVQGALVAGETA